MTKTKQARKSAKPAPVELQDKALDAAAGGAGTFNFTITASQGLLKK